MLLQCPTGVCTVRQEGVIPSIIHLLKTGDIQCVKVRAKMINTAVKVTVVYNGHVRTVNKLAVFVP